MFVCSFVDSLEFFLSIKSFSGSTRSQIFVFDFVLEFLTFFRLVCCDLESDLIFDVGPTVVYERLTLC